MQKNILNNFIINNKIELNSHEEKHIFNLFENEDLVNELKNNIENIINNGKIDLHSIPKLLLCIYKAYQLFSDGNIKNIDTLKIITFITKILLDIYVNDDDYDMKIIDEIINTSIELLKIDTITFKTINKCPFNLCCKRKIT